MKTREVKQKKDISNILEKWELFVKELEKQCIDIKDDKRRVDFHLLRYVCSCLIQYFSHKNLRNLFGFYLTSAMHPNLGTIQNYMESLYLSKDFEFFKNLKPIDAARYARFYLGKNKQKIDIRYLPYLIKHARLIKLRIYARIKRTKDKLGLSFEEAFKLVKEKHTSAKKPSLRKRKKLTNQIDLSQFF